MADIFDIVISIIGGIGGIGAVFYSIIRFSAKNIAEKMQKQYDLKLNEKFEAYKADIEGKKYISKTKFDTEFNIYKNLTKVFSDMIKGIYSIIPDGLYKISANKELQKKIDEENYNNAKRFTVMAQDELLSVVPFIPENFYDDYDEILKLCRMQLSVFEERWDKLNTAPQEKKETIPFDAYGRTTEIREKFKILCTKIREYLDEIDIIE